MNTPRLIKWANDGYPPIDLSNEFRAVIELIHAYKELESKQLHKPVVVRSLPTDEEICAQALLTVNDGDSNTGKIIHRAAFETGARWMKEKLSGQ